MHYTWVYLFSTGTSQLENLLENPCYITWILINWVTHIFVSKLTTIGSDNGLSPERRQVIIWTNAGILLIGRLKTNFNEMLVEILTFSFKKMCLKVSSAKWRPFCLGLNVWRLFSWFIQDSRPCHIVIIYGFCKFDQHAFLFRLTLQQNDPFQTTLSSVFSWMIFFCISIWISLTCE